MEAKQNEQVFHQRFEQEILLGEKLRVAILEIFFLVGLCIVLCVHHIIPEEYTELRQREVPIFWIYIFFISSICYLAMAHHTISSLVRKKEKFPKLLRYINAFVEASIPTVFILIVASPFTLPYALISPVVFIYFVFIVLSALQLDYRICLFMGSVAAIQYMIIAIGFMPDLGEEANHMLVDVVPQVIKGTLIMMAGVAAGFVTHEIRKRIDKSIVMLEERNRVVGIFGQHVSPSVVDKLLSQKKELDSEISDVCIMFLDIRGFTTFSENRKPEEIVDFLNVLFDFMIEIVNNNNGIINKFLGDGFMAIFGAPISDGRGAQNAVKAAQEIIARVEAESEAGNIPKVGVGIGLHAGQAVTGSIGSRLRKEYTVIGDVVNVAARIEQLNKQFSAKLLVSEEVWQSVSDRVEKVDCLGEVPVKGRDVPVKVYKLS